MTHAQDIRTRFLPTKRKKRYFRRPESRKSFSRALVAAALLSLTAAPAFAVNEPQLIGTFPASGGTARHVNVVDVAAQYDRDLDEHTLWALLLDNAAVPVSGFAHLAGPESPTGGRRFAAFHPTSILSEAASPYEVRIKVRAAVPTDVTTTIFSFSIDDTAPGVPVITSPVNGGVSTQQPVLAQGTAEAGANLIITEGAQQIAHDTVNDLGTFTIALPYPPEDGVTHAIAAQAVDPAGNVSPATPTLTFSHDSIVRVPIISAPAEGSSLNTSTITVSGNAKPNTTLTITESAVSIATTSVDGNGSWAVPVSFASGAHTISASSYDGVFNDGPSQARAFTIDLSAPAAPLISAPAPGAQLPSSAVTITGTTEPSATIRIREGSILRTTVGATAAGAWSATLAFNDGAHTITAQAIDAAGNLSATASRAFIVDTVAPASPVIITPAPSAFVNVNPVTVGGSAEAGSTVKVFEGTVQIGVATASGSGAWSTSITFTQAAHSIRAAAFDGAQNQSPLSPWTAFTVDTTAPGAPAITSPAPSSTSSVASVTIAGIAEASATVTIKEGVTTIGTTTATGSGDWWVAVSFANGAHTITARATDAAGNLSPASAPVAFTVSATGDVTPPPVPVITNPSSGSLQRGFVIFDGIAEPLSTVKIYEGLVLRVNGSADGAGNWRLGLTMVSGSHTVNADATDTAGNVSPMSAPRTFTVDAELPTVAFSTPGETIILPLQPIILEGWATDDTSVDRVSIEYRDLRNQLILTADAGVCTGCPDGSITWRATPPIGPGVYTAKASAVDTAGNRSEPASLHFYVL